MFTEIKRAWAFWTLAAQSFASIIDNSWGYDIKKHTTSVKVTNKRQSFTEDYAIRLQAVQIECTDALSIIKSRDNSESFFYCDPPYFNSNCGHYDGYTLEDFDMLLKTLSEAKGKFLLSSYPSPILNRYVNERGWHQIEIKSGVTVANANSKKPQKIKTEVLTVNYPIKL